MKPIKLVFGQEAKVDLDKYRDKTCIFISKRRDSGRNYCQIYIPDESVVISIYEDHLKPEPYPKQFTRMQQVMCGRTEHNEWYGPYHYTGQVKGDDGKWRYCTLEAGTFTQCKAYTFDAQKEIARQQSLDIISEIQKLKNKLKELENFTNATY